MMKLYPITGGIKRFTDVNRLASLVSEFEPISLSEIQDAALLNRVDTKYIIGMDQLCTILPELVGNYRALNINNTYLHNYRTLYFDTSAFTFYTQHHNRLGSRYKVRVRKYMDTDTAFFEIKHRTNQSRTIKSRMPIPDLVTQLGDPLIAFAHEHAACDADRLEPKLWNEYVRMTLVSKNRPERVTLDMNLRYYWKTDLAALSGIVIIEVKQQQHTQSAEIIQQMRRLSARPQSYSKYAAGVYSLYDGVKVNNFKPQIRIVNKIMQGVFQNEFTH